MQFELVEHTAYSRNAVQADDRIVIGVNAIPGEQSTANIPVRRSDTMIQIEIDPDAEAFFSPLFDEHPSEVQQASTKRFDGRPDTVEILISLTLVTLPIVARILTELIRARKSIVVKHKGLEVRGMSESNTKEILEALLQQEHAGKRRTEHDD